MFCLWSRPLELTVGFLLVGIQLYICLVLIYVSSPFYISILLTRRLYIYTSGIFHTSQTFICLDPHQILAWGWRYQTCLSPPVYILLTIPRRYFFCEYFFICASWLSCCFVCSLQPGGNLLKKGWPLPAFVCCVFFYLPIGCHMWYVIASISDICLPPYFVLIIGIVSA